MQADGKRCSIFYEALLTVLDAPHWHGRNINALIDSMIYGGINGVEPPYRIEVIHLGYAPENVREEVSQAISALAKARQDRIQGWENDVEVSMLAPDLSRNEPS